MATIQPIRGESTPAGPAANDILPANAVGPWLTGRTREDRLVDLLAFALATERDAPADPEAMAAMRQRAEAELAGYSIRHLHNRVAEIRQEAVLEHLGRFARPPGFLKLVLANLAGSVPVAALAGWLVLHPESIRTLAALVGLTPG